MKTKLFSIALVLCGVLLVLPLASAATLQSDQFVKNQKPFAITASHNIHYVGGNGPGNYTRIQDAIDNSSDGDTVFVYAGIYHESFTIRSPIQVIGQNRETTIVDGDYKDTVVRISGDGATLSGFTIRNSFYDISHGGVWVRANYTTITDCIVYNNHAGICLEDYCSNNGHNRVSGNSIHHNFDGVAVRGNSFDEISNNSFTHQSAAAIFAAGDFVFHCHSNNFLDNYLYGNEIGINFESYSSHMYVSRNIINHTRYSGICIGRVNDSIFSWNHIKDCGDFIIDKEYCSNNKYLHNDFINPPFHLYNTGAQGIPDYYLGNYWGRPRLLPKFILGNSLTHFVVIEVDWHPSIKQNLK